MARQTTCTTVAGVWDGVPGVPIVLGVIGALAAILAPIVLLVAALSVAGLTPASMAVAATALMFACLFGINLVHQVREYIFDHRLICLGGDKCALAQVHTMEKNGDGDRSLNTLLAPASLAAAEAGTLLEAEYRTWFQPQTLIYVDPGLGVRGFHLDPDEVRKPPIGTDLPSFHCEIEGTYFDELTTAVIAYLWGLFALAVAALALASIVAALGPLAWAIWVAVAILIILLIFLLGLFGGDDSESTDAGPLGDATPDITGPVITDIGGSTIHNRDFVGLIGRAVCDTGHNAPCWDELHPLLGITRIREDEYAKVPTTAHVAGDIYDQYCNALNEFVTGVGRVKQELTSPPPGEGGVPPSTGRVPCLEHPAIG